MIAKEPFVTALTAIIDRGKHKDDIYKGMQAIGIDIVSDPLEDAIVTLLDAALDIPQPPEEGFVSWFLSGTKMPAVLHLNDTKHEARTPAELYDMAVAYKTHLEAA